MKLNFPKKTKGLFLPDYRYYVMYGGRASGKSWAAARAIIIMSLQSKIRVLCVRETMSSISHSVHKLLKDQIEAMNLTSYFDTTNNKITAKNGSDFIFSGIRDDPAKIKSTEGVDVCFIEEAESISETSWQILIPTIRKPGSKFIIVFNPKNKSDPTYQRFVINTPPKTWLQKINYKDNPYCPQEAINEANYCRSISEDDYQHIWEGNPLELSDAIIFKGKFSVKEFDSPDWTDFLHGMDFGFSADPTAMIRCYTKDGDLYIDYEAGGYALDYSEYPDYMNSIPTGNWKWYADCAYPGVISGIHNMGYFIEGAKKWSGSVSDGIAYIRSFKNIFIHPRCEKTIEEFQKYQWKVDKVSGDIQPIPLDKDNHYIDALRYALSKYIENKDTSLAMWEKLGN